MCFKRNARKEGTQTVREKIEHRRRGNNIQLVHVLQNMQEHRAKDEGSAVIVKSRESLTSRSWPTSTMSCRFMRVNVS